MIHEGQVVLFRFPHPDQTTNKLRPALILSKLPGYQNDWLVCMISTQLSQEVKGFDELIQPTDSDFATSGLKRPSLIRIGRIAVTHQSILQGAIGEIDDQRLQRIRRKLSDWLKDE